MGTIKFHTALILIAMSAVISSASASGKLTQAVFLEKAKTPGIGYLDALHHPTNSFDDIFPSDQDKKMAEGINFHRSHSSNDAEQQQQYAHQIQPVQPVQPVQVAQPFYGHVVYGQIQHPQQQMFGQVHLIQQAPQQQQQIVFHAVQPVPTSYMSYVAVPAMNQPQEQERDPRPFYTGLMPHYNKY